MGKRTLPTKLYRFYNITHNEDMPIDSWGWKVWGSHKWHHIQLSYRMLFVDHTCMAHASFWRKLVAFMQDIPGIRFLVPDVRYIIQVYQSRDKYPGAWNRVKVVWLRGVVTVYGLVMLIILRRVCLH